MRQLEHDNLNRFMGISSDGVVTYSLWKFHPRGNLRRMVVLPPAPYFERSIKPSFRLYELLSSFQLLSSDLPALPVAQLIEHTGQLSLGTKND
ncbi:hypothetical protein KIN20_036858 [Parelaphostrongylus tenuis]|uniref:Serine-threonine/tyrosine-protein kinase catalytic domain-containing protein n=1 Tax=Parelaphostrongylus tenuis TaxID=148309 RepID=A0AAD5WKR6_PARTN|nr:hypothetical protein KIN20_036858 [Parelaphostrongylus tenuis]